jgi:hypothetical protein
MGLATLGIEDAADVLRVVSGRVDPARLTLFSTMKNEMAFLPGWLAHHRALGFAQFLIWDDASDDGTSEYLAAQGDVVVLRARQSFGTQIVYRDPAGRTRDERFGTYVKIAAPHMFFDGAFVAYLDADEFLILPPGVGSVGEVVARLDAAGAASAVASVVEFFPRDVAGLGREMPADFDGLIAAYPYFEPEPLVRLVPGAQPELTGRSKTAALFERYDIRPEIVRRGWHRLWMPSRARKAQSFRKSPRHKTPLVRRDARSYLTGSHYSVLPPSPEVLLTVAHFVFTAQFADKIARATAWGAHANGAQKYRYYARLLEAMRDVPDGFLSDSAQRFEDPRQLVDCGLMRW